MASAGEPIEEYKEAGLYDPSVDSDTGRLELLQWLTARGFSREQMQDAAASRSLGAMAGDQAMRPGRALTDVEIEELTELPAATTEALAATFGFASIDPERPEGVSLSQQEADALALFGMVAGIFSNDEALGFARVVGAAMAKVSEAAVSLFLSDVEGPYLATTGNELELAKKVLGAVELLDQFIPMLDPILRRHVLQAVQRSRIAIIDDTERLQYRYAVGFVDLVGFTPLSSAMSPIELGVFIRDFEARAHDAVTAAGARLVKLIGDEVMFVAPDADSACVVAQSLMSDFFTVDGDNVVPRGGVAFGPVLVRGGDYYGDVVNMASRLVDGAAPGELLVTKTFADAVTCLEFTPPADRLLKGFAEPVAVQSLMVENH
jgi:class 3 adenylate cyclase